MRMTTRGRIASTVNVDPTDRDDRSGSGLSPTTGSGDVAILEEFTIGGLHDFLFAHVLPRFPIRAGRAVDLGAGSGALAVRLRQMHWDVLAVDRDAARFHADVPFIQADLDQPDFATRLGEHVFDLVTSVEVIEHLENPIGFLRNVGRLLRPAGIAVITTPNVDSAPARVKFLLRGKLRFLGDARDDTHISPIFCDLLVRQYLPRAELQLAVHHVYPTNGYKVNLPRSAWAFRLLARVLPGPALLGDTNVFVLKRRNTAREGRTMETQRAIDCRTGVIVAHPGTQHSYETALAVQQAGLLHSFLTGFYYRPESTPARALRLLPNGHGTKLERELFRRFKPALVPEKVHSYPVPEMLYLAASRLGPFRRFCDVLLRWRNERFDGWVAETLARQRPKAVVCYDSCARRAFERAKSLGILCVLDQSIGHIQSGLQLFQEEAKLHPEFADSLPTRVPDWLVERCCEELRLADAVLVSSSYAKQTLLDHGVPEDKITLNPYGAEIKEFRPVAPTQGQPFRVLFVGQIGQRKGIKYLLEAFKQLALPDAELLLVGSIVGSGSGLRPYRKYFTHVPHVPHAEVHRYFQAGTIFVMPSLHESGVLAIHEALACGLPVIATPNCGSVVQDGVEGFIVPIRDVETLKEKILLLYENKELRKEMSCRARLRAEQFTWAAYRGRLGGVLRHLLEARE